jgi:Asp-tRNA(Asn)/Glu-tRNA(Gln) amidotransferase A subunit family amidase
LNILGSSVSNFGGESITANNGVSINIEGKTTPGIGANAVAFANMTIKALPATAGGTAGNINIKGTSSTGNAIFNGLWTLCGTPAVTLPVLRGATGLPIGLQLIGRRGEDARLLSIAAWVARSLAG